MHRGNAFPGWLLVAVLTCAAGCSGCQKAETFPVKGTLLVGGKPAGRANLVFHAVDQRVIARPVGFTDPDGSFRLMTHAIDDGAAPGEYVVTIFWRDESVPFDACAGDELIKHDRLRGLYFDSRKSTLRATVRREPNEVVIEVEGSADQNSIAGSLDLLKRSGVESNGSPPE
ncbi:MAG: hypothetical protein JWP89_5594 [Schlesneria sp.]|nr:hypothetical protein [Schlesneria sp.]